MQALVPALAGVVSGILFFSSAAKGVEPQFAARAMVGFGITRRESNRLARAVAVGEFALAVLLLLPTLYAVLAGLALSAGLFALFVAVQVRALARHQKFPCGCFAGTDVISLLTIGHAALPLAICLIAIVLFPWSRTNAYLTVPIAVETVVLMVAARFVVTIREHQLFG